MKKLTFSIQIDAPKEQVWNVLWNDESYRAWTSVFHPGSYAKSDWKEGSKILFLGGDGNDGMISTIARLIPNEFMSFQHLGELKNGVEDYDSPSAKGWAGAMENYTLQEKNGGTELSVELDADNSFADYFTQAFPKALDKVKELAEKG
jgi:uncharacterized protein YndB with AHSA1/START domain